jgi:MFS family permease
LGASAAVAGVIVALRGLGTLIFDIPAGALVARLGEKWAMVSASVSLALVTLGVALKPSLVVYALLIFLMGCAWSVWTLARLAYVTEVTPLRFRGRAMSTMGGTSRIGQFLGPLLGGLVIAWWGIVGPFVIHAVFALAAAAAMALVKEPAVNHRSEQGHISLRGVIRDNLRVLGTAGMVSITIQVMRSAREVIVPLWGDHLQLSGSQISLIYGLSSGVEMLLFYPIGILMDRKGRRWSALPCLAILAIGLAMIPLTSTLVGLLSIGILLGLGNGLGSGINMTLGSDLSPTLGRSQFFGVWRLMGDAGSAMGPLLLAAVTSIATLGAAAVVTGAVGIVGAGIMWKTVPETLRLDGS